MKTQFFKRLLAALLVCAMVCGFAWAADGVVMEAKAPAQPVKIGDTVTIPVELIENPGFACGGVEISWDKAAFRLKSVKYGVVPDNGSAPIGGADPDFYLVNMGDDMTEEGFAARGTAFSVEFSVLADAKTENCIHFSVQQGSFLNCQWDLCDASISGCTVFVSDGKPLTSLPEDAPAAPAQPEKTADTLLNGAILLPIGSYAALYHGGVVAIYPGERAVVPYIQNDRTFVPIRFVAEKLGAKVDWDNAARTVIVEKDGHKLLLPVGSMTYTLDGKELTLDAPAEIRGDRTMVPLRLVAEGLGNQVEWDAANRVAIVVDGEKWDMADALTGEAIAKALTMIAMYKGFV